MSARNQSAGGVLQGQGHDSDIGQASAEHRPCGASVAGEKRAHIRADIIGVGNIRIDFNASDGNIGQVAADIGPRCPAIDGLKHVPNRIAKA